MSSAARLFVGHVMHRRLRPAVNAFVYPVFYVQLPLRELAVGNCGIFSVDRANLLSGAYPAFAACVVTASGGSHTFTWTALPDATNYAATVTRGGAAVLLAGDLGAAQEEALAGGGAGVAAGVLVVGRHGDAAATSVAWLDAVRPAAAIVSSGEHADSRHPDESTLARLERRGIPVWRTDRQGAIQVELDAQPARWPERGWRIRAALP
jgi:hypothetical protein